MNEPPIDNDREADDWDRWADREDFAREWEYEADQRLREDGVLP